MNEWATEAKRLVAAFPWNFETFGDAKLGEMFSGVRNFAFDFLLWNTKHPKAKDPYWLVICGPSECGKTFLIHQLNKFISQFDIHPAPWLLSKTKNRRIYSKFFEASHIVHDALSRHGNDFPMARDSDVLCLDDLGTDNAREAAIDVLYRLVSWRSERGEQPGKWTAITTNLTPEQIGEQYDPRLASRLRRGGNRVIQLPKGFTPYHDRK